MTVDAVTDGGSTFVGMTPCRLFDTRPGGVGLRNTPLGADETPLFQVTGTNGDATIPGSRNRRVPRTVGLVVGRHNAWNDDTAVVFGDANMASEAFATVLGGSDDVASGRWSTVSGGWKSTTSGWRDTVASGDDVVCSTAFPQAATCGEGVLGAVDCEPWSGLPAGPGRRLIGACRSRRSGTARSRSGRWSRSR